MATNHEPPPGDRGHLPTGETTIKAFIALGLMAASLNAGASVLQLDFDVYVDRHHVYRPDVGGVNTAVEYIFPTSAIIDTTNYTSWYRAPLGQEEYTHSQVNWIPGETILTSYLKADLGVATDFDKTAVVSMSDYPEYDIQDEKYMRLEYTDWKCRPGYSVCGASNSLSVYGMQFILPDGMTSVPEELGRFTDEAELDAFIASFLGMNFDFNEGARNDRHLESFYGTATLRSVSEVGEDEPTGRVPSPAPLAFLLPGLAGLMAWRRLY